MSLETIGKFIKDTRIIGRATASGIIIYGLDMIREFMINSNVQPEMLAVGASIVTAASTYLFMSETK